MKKSVQRVRERLLREIDYATLPPEISKKEALWILEGLASDFECRCDCLRDEIQDEEEAK